MSIPALLAAVSLLLLGLGASRHRFRPRADGRFGRLLGYLIAFPLPGQAADVIGRLPVGRRVRDGLCAVGLSHRDLAACRASATCCVACGALTATVVHPIVGLVALATALFAPVGVDLLVSRAGHRYRNDLVRQLPDALELLSTASGAGMALDPALNLVAGRVGGPVGRELDLTRRDLEHGASRSSAYAALRQRVATPEVDQLVGALLRADRLGSPLADTLSRQADAMRHTRAQRARDRAARAAPKIQLIVAVLMVPATLMLVIGLLLIELTRQVNAVIGAG